MADVFTKEKRSQVMRRIVSKNTKPEKKVRSILHNMGYRFRVHKKQLPGKPDIVLKKHNQIIFVHGCFWHQHKGCRLNHYPKSNLEYWKPKLIKNINRFKDVKKHLISMGWKVSVIWECQTKDIENLTELLIDIMHRKNDS